MAIEAALYLAGTDNINNGDPVSLVLTNQTDGITNTIILTATIDGQDISLSFVPEDIQELGRRIDLLVP